MNTIVCPGSFGFPGCGHPGAWQRAARLIDHPVVGVAAGETWHLLLPPDVPAEQRDGFNTPAVQECVQ